VKSRSGEADTKRRSYCSSGPCRRSPRPAARHVAGCPCAAGLARPRSVSCHARTPWGSPGTTSATLGLW